MKSTITIIILSLFATACSNKKEKIIKFTQEEISSLQLDSVQQLTIQKNGMEEIDLNFLSHDQKYNFGDMIDSIEILPLETTDKSLLASINNILVCDSFVYIVDSYEGSSVVVFDRKGKFVKRIRKGQGPGEILPHFKSLAFDTQAEELILLHNHFFSFYTTDGQYKRRIRIPFNAAAFAILPDGYLFHVTNGLNNQHIDPNIHYQLLVTDKEFKIKSTSFPYTYGDDNFYEGQTRCIDQNENTINFTFKFNNNIYQYVDPYKVKQKYTLNLGKKEIPKHILTLDYRSLMNNLTSNDYYFFLGEHVENHQHDFFKLTNLYKAEITFVYRDKKTGNIKGGSRTISDRALYPPLRHPISSYKGRFVSYSFIDENIQLLTSKVLPESMVKILKSQTEDDNPVLIFYILKDF